MKALLAPLAIENAMYNKLPEVWMKQIYKEDMKVEEIVESVMRFAIYYSLAYEGGAYPGEDVTKH
jgi:hypothetical protein